MFASLHICRVCSRMIDSFRCLCYCVQEVKPMKHSEGKAKKIRDFVKNWIERYGPVLGSNLEAMPDTRCRYKRRFNLDLPEYEALLKYQKGGCAGCGRKPKKRRLAVDHDHDPKSLLIRGLLCWRCNTVLGHLQDDLDLLTALWAYLMYPPAFHVIGHRKAGKVRG